MAVETTKSLSCAQCHCPGTWPLHVSRRLHQLRREGQVDDSFSFLAALLLSFAGTFPAFLRTTRIYQVYRCWTVLRHTILECALSRHQNQTLSIAIFTPFHATKFASLLLFCDHAPNLRLGFKRPGLRPFARLKGGRRVYCSPEQGSLEPIPRQAQWTIKYPSTRRSSD